MAELTPFQAVGATLGGNVLGATINGLFQNHQNKVNYKRSIEMYERQKADDYSKMSAENAYNSPQQQMQRFKEAGLNPHLIYGNGTSSSTSVHGDSPSHNMPNMPAPQIQPDLGSQGIGAYQNVMVKEAQTDNLKVLARVAGQEELLKAAQILNTLQNTAGAEQQFNNTKALFDGQLKEQELRIQAAEQGINLNQKRYELELSEFANKKLQTISNVQKQAAEVSKILTENARQIMENKAFPLDVKQKQELLQKTQNENLLKQIDIKLQRDMNISPGDPGYWRVFMKALYPYANLIK
ncbi:MAG: DNA pilot protein [Microvirus sp.]|nr:MAG: DNA pilot protein [Microvirus sp.]